MNIYTYMKQKNNVYPIIPGTSIGFCQYLSIRIGSRWWLMECVETYSIHTSYIYIQLLNQSCAAFDQKHWESRIYIQNCNMNLNLIAMAPTLKLHHLLSKHVCHIKKGRFFFFFFIENTEFNVNLQHTDNCLIGFRIICVYIPNKYIYIYRNY